MRNNGGSRAALIAALLVGTALGFGAGFVVFGGDQTPPAAPNEDAREVAESVPRTTRVRERHQEPEQRATQPAPGGEEPTEEPEALNSPPDLVTLKAALDKAVAEKDSGALRAALNALAESGCAGADELIVGVMADESIPLKHPWGGRFEGWLENSQAPGIVQHARRRFERALAEGTTSWVATNGWFALIASKGTVEDAEWLLARKESSQITHMATRALAKAPPAILGPLLDGLLAEEGWSSRARELLTDVEGEWANPYYERMVRACVAGRPTAGGLSLPDLMRGYGGTLPEDRLRDARNLLSGLPEQSQRIAAVYAVQRLRRRELDVSGFEAILHEPGAALVRLAAEPANTPGASTIGYRAMYAIEYNRILWTEPSAAALELAAAGKCGPTRDMARVAKKIRARLRDSAWE